MKTLYVSSIAYLTILLTSCVYSEKSGYIRNNLSKTRPYGLVTNNGAIYSIDGMLVDSRFINKKVVIKGEYVDRFFHDRGRVLEILKPQIRMHDTLNQ